MPRLPSLCRADRLLLWCLVPLVALRLAAQTFVPLMHQEAYYWMYAQHPSLSYFDHPPMVAWVIGLGTAVVGDNETGVRIVGSLLMLLNGVIMYHAVRLWWGRAVAFASAATVQIAPVYFGIGFLATMDSALLTFWLVSLVGFGHAVRRGQTWGWYVCGVGLGGALLSKYTGVFLLPGVGLLMVTHRPWRRHLVTPHPYLAALLGVAMFWPVLVWNWQHDWASFRFQFLSRYDAAEGSHKHPLLEFLGSQAGVATPVVLVGFVLVGYRAVTRRRLAGRDKMALAFAVPLLLSVAHKAWDYPVHINWTAPAYLSFVPAAWQAARVRVRAGTAWPAFAWRGGIATPTLGVCAVVNVTLLGYLLLVQPRMHTASSLFGPWDELAAQVERCENDLEAKTGREPLVIVDGKYELASLVAFYRNRTDAGDLPADFTVSQVAIGGPSLNYRYWFDRARWIGTDCVFVDVDADSAERLAGRFKSVKIVWQGKASNGRRYCISECRDYLG